jgi:deoxyribose-phosphate aldolase
MKAAVQSSSCFSRKPQDKHQEFFKNLNEENQMKGSDLAKHIEHACLKPNSTKTDIEKLCKEAIEYNFKAVCVNPAFVPLAASLLKGKKTIIVATVGFPFGASQSSTKAFEAKEAIQAGAEEIDMVINIGALKEKEYQLVYEDINGVVNEVKPNLVKVIIEACFLEREEKIIACAIAQIAGAAFVKTSTGFAEFGAKEEDVRLMRATVGSKMKIKASGGIKTYEDALKMINAGAERIGSSHSVNIVIGK